MNLHPQPCKSRMLPLHHTSNTTMFFSYIKVSFFDGITLKCSIIVYKVMFNLNDETKREIRHLLRVRRDLLNQIQEITVYIKKLSAQYDLVIDLENDEIYE